MGIFSTEMFAQNWTSLYGTTSEETGAGARFTANGEIYTVGETRSNATTFGDIVVSRLNSMGGVISTRTYATQNATNAEMREYPEEFILTANGDLVIIGIRYSSNTATTPSDHFIMRVDGTTGAHLWTRIIGLPSAYSNVLDVIEMANGNIAVAGGTGTGSTTDGYLHVYNGGTGTLVFDEYWDGGSNNGQSTSGIGILEHGTELWVSCNHNGANTMRISIERFLSSTGAYQGSIFKRVYTTNTNNTPNRQTYPFKMINTANPNNNTDIFLLTWVADYLQTQTYDMVLTRMTSTGTVVWENYYRTGANRYEVMQDMFLVGSQIVLVGVEGTGDSTTTATNTNGMVLCVNAGDGTVAYAKSIGDAASEDNFMLGGISAQTSSLILGGHSNMGLTGGAGSNSNLLVASTAHGAFVSPAADGCTVQALNVTTAAVPVFTHNTGIDDENAATGNINIVLSAAQCTTNIATYVQNNPCVLPCTNPTVTLGTPSLSSGCNNSIPLTIANTTFPVNINVIGTNGGSNFSVIANSSPFTLTGLCAGEYTYQVISGNCTTGVKYIMQNICQGFNVSITAINLAYPACNSNVDILIGGGAASLPAQVFTTWSTGGAPGPLTANNNTYNIFGECPETYTTYVTNAQGCKDTIYYAIPQCVDTAICVGSSIILSAWDDKFHAPFTTGNQITGNWLVNGVAAGSGATLNISPTANTNYIFNGQLNNVVNGVSTFVQFVNFCVNVNLTTPPTLTATASPATICAGQTSTLSVTGGAMNAMYRWYRMPATNLGTGMTKVVAPSVTTTYYAIVDCAPCTDTAWVTVNVVQPTQATITGPSAICGTQAVSLTATGGGTYAWKQLPFASIVGTAATLNVASLSTTRTYTVTATNAPCPTTTASHTITVNPIPNVTLPLPTGCRIVGQPLTFNATSTSNIATWNWGNNPNTPTGVTSTANNSAATYMMVSGTNTNVVSLSVTDVNGCSKATTVSVSPNNLVATIAQPIQSGACNSRKFTVSLSGLTSAAGTVVSYDWVFKNLTQNTQVTQTTTTNTATQLFAAPGIDVYEVCVTLTTSLGCTTSVCMTPNLPACSCNIAANFCTTAGTPPASGTAIPVIFNNTSTGGGATGLQYIWNWGDGTPNTTLTSTAATTHNFASTLTSSNVELTVTGTSNGMQCCQKVNIPVTIPRPCPITSTNVTGFNYRQNATGSITFYSNIVAPTGCVYSWNFGNSTTSTAVSPTYTYPVAGTYTACLTITHTATGCSKTFCQSIIAAPAPNCNLIPRYTATRCTGAPLDISFNVVNNTSGIAPSNVTYSWTFGDGTSDVSTSPSISHTFPSTGNYVVCLQKVTANCTTNVCHTFNVQMPTYANCSPAPTGLKTTKGDDKGNEEELVPLDGNNWLLNKVEIVPNPAKNITNLHFSLANNAEVRMEAYSMEGKGIWEKTTSLPAGQQNEEINLLGWAAGMYIIRVTTGEEVQNIKLVVEN